MNSWNVPTYLQADYLDFLLGPENWAVAIANTKFGEPIAAVPYTYANLRRWKCILPVPYVPFTGLLHASINHASDQKKFSYEKRLWQDIMEHMPNERVSVLKLPPDYFHPVFQWRGCDVRMAHTSRLKLTSEENVWSNFKSSLKSDIRFASDKLIVEENNHKAFIDCYEKGILQKNITHLLSADKLSSLLFDQHWVQFQTFTAHIDNSVTAGILLLNDGEITYYMVSSKATLSVRGANGLLLWEAIKSSIRNGRKIFDFEGSQIASIQKYFSSFNPQIVPYMKIYGFKNQIYRAIFQIVKGF